MKKRRIFDFDGVLFQHPSHCIQEMVGELPEELVWRICMEGGFFSSEMIEEESILPYYQAFVARYFSKKMSSVNVSRLENMARDSELAIASLNNKGTIEKHLELSGIRHLFGPIFTRDGGLNKKEMLRRACEGYDPETEVTFTTDTVDDILAARSIYPGMRIEVVVTGVDDWRSLVGYVGEHNIVAPFY